jgi:hypothetical protein
MPASVSEELYGLPSSSRDANHNCITGDRVADLARVRQAAIDT